MRIDWSHIFLNTRFTQNTNDYLDDALYYLPKINNVDLSLCTLQFKGGDLENQKIILVLQEQNSAPEHKHCATGATNISVCRYTAHTCSDLCEGIYVS